MDFVHKDFAGSILAVVGVGGFYMHDFYFPSVDNIAVGSRILLLLHAGRPLVATLGIVPWLSVYPLTFAFLRL